MSHGQIKLAFDGLTPDQAHVLLAAYQQVMESARIANVASEIAAQIAPTAFTQPPTVQPAPPAAPAPTAFTQPAVAPAPAVQPAPAVFTQPAAAPAPTTSTAAVDIEGVPYNAELHAPLTGKTGGKLTTGAWKANRKADRAAYDAWRAKHVGSAPAPTAFTQPPAAPAPTVQPAPTAFTQPAVTPAPTAFTQPAAAPAPTATEVIGEDVLLEKSGILASRGLLTQQVVAEIIRRAGASDNIDLVRDPAKRSIAWACLLQIEATGQLA